MPEFDPRNYPYSSHRNVVYARKAMACTSIPQGAQIGLDVMKAGGSAVDAAVAMAAAMPLLEPTSNGLGSDCFALVWIEKEKKLYGLNASGTAPAALSAERVRALGFSEMPKAGWIPTLVPGAPAGWAELSRRFGTKPLTELFAPAIRSAREGVPVAVNLEPMWAEDSRRIGQAMAENPAPHAYWWEKFTKNGQPYRAGDIFRWEEYAQTLEELAATNCESYYRGPLMEKIVAFSRETGGYFAEEDFRSYRPMWVEPISVDYKGYTVCEIPPNGHGITVLMALNILKGLDLSPERERADTYHKIIESIKLAFADTKTYVADPRYMKTKVEDMLSQDYAARRRALIGETALLPQAGTPPAAGPSICAPPTRRGTWSPSSRATTPPSAPEWPSPAPASPCRTGGPTSPWTRTAQLPGRGQAVLPHHHPRISDEGRGGGGSLRGHGGLYAAPGPRAGGGEHHRLPSEPPGRPGRPPVPVDRRETRPAGAGGARPYRPGARPPGA